MSAKAYIGDGVYVRFDGQRVVLTTSDGFVTTNRIVIEPEVYLALITYVKGLASWPLPLRGPDA